MSLDTALAHSLTGMNVSQRLFSIASQNISRANEEDYVRIKADLGSNQAGNLKVKHVKREVDQLLSAERRSRVSSLEYFNTKSEVISRAQDYLGVPDILGGGANAKNINSMIDKFFATLSMLSISPDDIGLKSSAVLESSKLTSMISGAARNIEDTRYDCDRSIQNLVQDVNHDLKSLHTLNIARSKTAVSSTDDELLANLDIKADKILKQISESMNITVIMVDNKYHLSSSGVNLLNENLYEINYRPSSSVSSIINCNDFNAVTVNLASNKSSSQTIIPAGQAPVEAAVNLAEGKLKALAELRDIDLPNMLDHLDNLSYVVTQYFNETYSAGINYPGKDNLISDKLLSKDEVLDFSGKVKFLPLDSNGAPVSIGNYDYIKPLEIDFSNPKHGKNAYTTENLIDEINEFFTLGASRVELPYNVDDVRIASVLNSDRKFHFNFEVDNNDDSNVDFGVHKVRVYYKEDNGDLVELEDALVTDVHSKKFRGYDIKANAIERTKDVISLNLHSAPSGVNRFIIRADMNINNSLAEIDFDIRTDASNQRYSACGVVSGEAEIIPRTNGNRYVRASLVDKHGNPVDNRSERGCLKLTAPNSGFRIVIDDVDSVENNSDSIIPRNFFHALGMNNLFKEQDDKKNAAINMRVEDSLLGNYSGFNTGVLQISKFATSTHRAKWLETGSVGAGNNLTVLKLANLSSSKVNFTKAGNLSQTSATFSEYSIYLISDAISLSRSYQDGQEREGLFKDNLDAKFNSISGVNINEELANMEVLEKGFAAQARVASVLSDIHDSMMQAFS